MCYKAIIVAISVRTTSITCVAPAKYVDSSHLELDEDWLLLVTKDGEFTKASIDKLETLARARASVKGYISWRRLTDAWIEVLKDKI